MACGIRIKTTLGTVKVFNGYTNETGGNWYGDFIQGWACGCGYSLSTKDTIDDLYGRPRGSTVTYSNLASGIVSGMIGAVNDKYITNLAFLFSQVSEDYCASLAFCMLIMSAYTLAPA